MPLNYFFVLFYVLLNRKFLRKKILSFYKEEKVHVDKRKKKIELKLFTCTIFEETRIKRKEKMQWKLGFVNFFKTRFKRIQKMQLVTWPILLD